MLTPEQLITAAQKLVDAKNKKQEYRNVLDKLKNCDTSIELLVEQNRGRGRAMSKRFPISPDEAHDIIFPKYCAIEKEIMTAQKEYEEFLKQSVEL